MRYAEIIKEANDPLDVAFLKIASYTQHNEPIDFNAVSEVIHAHGYREPFGPGTYYRALFHPLTDADIKNNNTLRELFPALKSGIRMDLVGAQGFTTTLESAEEFVNGTLHVTHGHESFPQHHPDTPLTDVRNIIVIYEVVAPAGSILWSMKGLRALLTISPKGTGWAALHHALNDIWDGYGDDDEVVIDTSVGVKITGVHFYNSDSYSD